MPPPDRGGPADAPIGSALPALVDAFARQLTEEPWAAALPVLLDAARRHPALRARMHQFLEQRQAPVRDVLSTAVRAGELDTGLDVDAAVAQLMGPLVFRRIVSAEPLDAAFRSAVVTGFLDGHRTGAADGTGGGERPPPA